MKPSDSTSVALSRPHRDRTTNASWRLSNSRYPILTFLKTRSETAQHMDNILAHIRRTKTHTHRLVHTDIAKEYTSSSTQSMYHSIGVIHTTIVPYSTQENFIAKRVSRTLLNAPKPALQHSGLPTDHSEDEVKEATFKYNHTLHLGTCEIPCRAWHGHTPRCSNSS